MSRDHRSLADLVFLGAVSRTDTRKVHFWHPVLGVSVWTQGTLRHILSRHYGLYL